MEANENDHKKQQQQQQQQIFWPRHWLKIKTSTTAANDKNISSPQTKTTTTTTTRQEKKRNKHKKQAKTRQLLIEPPPLLPQVQRDQQVSLRNESISCNDFFHESSSSLKFNKRTAKENNNNHNHNGRFESTSSRLFSTTSKFDDDNNNNNSSQYKYKQTLVESTPNMISGSRKTTPPSLSSDGHHHNLVSSNVGSQHTAAAAAAAAAATTMKHNKQQRKTNTRGLSTFLTILFGSLIMTFFFLLLLLSLASATTAAADHKNNTTSITSLTSIHNTSTTTTTTTTPSQPSHLLIEQPNELGSGGSSSAIINNKQEVDENINGDETAGEEKDDEGDEEGGASLHTEAKTDKSRLVEALAEAAGSGADLLVDKLRKSSSSNDDDDGDDDDDDDRNNNDENHTNKDSSESLNEKDQHDELKPITTSSDNLVISGSDASLDKRKRSEAPEADKLVNTSTNNNNDKNNYKNSKQPTTTTTTAAAAATSQQQQQQLKLAMEAYQKWRSTGDDIIELFSRKLLPVIIEHGYDVDSSTVGGLLQVFNGIRTLKPWALKLLDASAKLMPGILVGTQSDFGDFDECLNVRSDDPSGLGANLEFAPEIDQSTGLSSTTLVGRYCLADVEFPKPPREFHWAASAYDDNNNNNNNNNNSNKSSLLISSLRSNELPIDGKWAPIELRRPLLNFSTTAAYKETIFVETGNFFHMLYVDPIRVGVCLTNKIDPDHLASVINKLLEEFKITINFRGRCVTKYERQEWSLYQVVSAYILTVACSLVLISTLFELIEKKLSHFPVPKQFELNRLKLSKTFTQYKPLMTSFSVIRNTKRLFKPQQQQHSARDNLITTPNKQSANKNKLDILRNATNQRLANMVGASVELSSSSLLSSCATSTTTTTTTTNGGPSMDSSVESSPSIERRMSSSIDGGSSVELILNEQRLAGGLKSRPIMAVNNFADEASTGSSSSSSGSRSRSSSNSSNSSASGGSLKQNRNQQQLQLYNQINMNCLHGIRVITMTWMIVNHTYMFGGFFVLWAHRRLIDIAEWPKSMSFQLVLNGWLTVETYFFLSALIIVLNVMPLMGAKRFNYLSYIVHRLIRLMPAYIGLVCLNFLWPLISSGPVWLVKGKSFVQWPCENYLWTNFLFINNWIWPEKQCMVHTWFLSADFQLYLLAPIVVYLLYRRPAFGHTLNLLVALLASILSGLVIYANQLLPTTLINKLEFDAIKQQLSYSYFATYQHMGPYCLGILTGYILHKRPQITLPRHLTWSLWFLLPPLSFTTLMLTYLWNGAYEDPALINPSPLVSALYVAIHRIIWTSLVAWLVFACSTGRAKLISSFLSHSAFVPISRLSYSIYLVHLPVIMFRALNLRHTVEWSDQNILWEACGNFIASLIMGFFVNITFESPVINIENALFRRSNSSSISSNNNNNNKFDGTVKSICKTPKQRLNNLPHQISSLTDDCCKPKTGLQQLKSGTIEQKGFDFKQQQMDLASGSSSSRSETSDKNSSTKEPDTVQDTSTASSRSSSLSVGQPVKLNKRSSMANSSMGNVETGTLSMIAGGRILAESPRSARPMNGNSNNNRLLPSRLVNSSNSEDIYNVNAEYRHYAPGAYQQWRMLPQLGAANNLLAASTTLPQRPQQYATLARTNRLSRNSKDYTTTNGLYYNNNFNQFAPQAPLRLDLPSVGFNAIRQQQYSSQSYAPISRRQGRYNTLTGTGREWPSRMMSSSYAVDANYSNPIYRRQIEEKLPTYFETNNTLTSATDAAAASDPYRANWPKQFIPTRQESTGASDETPSATILNVQRTSQQQQKLTNWNIQPGLMIPRIDSSTLRRQTRRNEPNANDSRIVEETADEENSAL